MISTTIALGKIQNSWSKWSNNHQKGKICTFPPKGQHTRWCEWLLTHSNFTNSTPKQHPRIIIDQPPITPCSWNAIGFVNSFEGIGQRFCIMPITLILITPMPPIKSKSTPIGIETHCKFGSATALYHARGLLVSKYHPTILTIVQKTKLTTMTNNLQEINEVKTNITRYQEKHN